MDYGKHHEQNLKLIVAIARVALAHERSTSRFLASYGLTLPQFGVLEVLYHKGNMRVCEIIDKTLSTSGNMTVIIKNLEAEGYIYRLADVKDRRAYQIGISDKGKALMAELFPKHVEEVEDWAKVLTDKEKTELLTLMKKLGGRL